MMVFNFNTAESNFKTLRQNKIGVRKGETEIALKKKKKQSPMHNGWGC